MRSEILWTRKNGSPATGRRVANSSASPRNSERVESVTVAQNSVAALNDGSGISRNAVSHRMVMGQESGPNTAAYGVSRDFGGNGRRGEDQARSIGRAPAFEVIETGEAVVLGFRETSYLGHKPLARKDVGDPNKEHLQGREVPYQRV